MYIKGSVEAYLSDLAARKPAPGGGSAAALTAAAGVALMSMVANYTIGNPKYKSGEENAKKILNRTLEARKELEALIDMDVEAYSKLSKIMKETKDASKLEMAYKEAIKPPCDICRISAECLKLCDGLIECGNKNLITDTAIAVIFLEGAFFAAKYNVYINMRYIKDMDFIGSIHNILQPMEEQLPKLKEEFLEKCEEVIR
ncbi:MAG: cyclodeaminase/cyclohydrolase family protein [Candidatus Omnitrophota bacterium]|nr:cyclodeaminase/cyclohydrolase family protein [Candidatus Omnitrophota bacterium]